MAVPASGELKLWDTLWNQELAGTKGENSLHSASVYAGFSTPDALSDFYGWSDVEIPTITTQTETGVTQNSFTANGCVTNTGNGTVYRGFYMGTNSSNPGTSNPKYTLPGTTTSTGTFNCNFTGLTYLTNYYYWAWGCNEAGETISCRQTATTTAPPFTPNYCNNVHCRTYVESAGGAFNNSATSCLKYEYVNPYTSQRVEHTTISCGFGGYSSQGCKSPTGGRAASNAKNVVCGYFRACACESPPFQVNEIEGEFTGRRGSQITCYGQATFARSGATQYASENCYSPNVGRYWRMEARFRANNPSQYTNDATIQQRICFCTCLV